MTFQKIICPLDFSAASYLGLQHAIVLASPNLTELCIIHIEKASALTSGPLPPSAGAVIPYAPTTPLPAEAQKCAEAITNLCSALEDRVPDSLRSRPLLKRGEAAEEILRVAREESADLIVLTARGSGEAPGKGGSLGSVAQAILRGATCSVVIVSTPASEVESAMARSN